MNIHAPSQIRLSSEQRLESRTIHDRFAFLRYLLTTREFREAMERILALPHHRAVPESVQVDVRKKNRPGRALMSSIAGGHHRTPLLPSHPIFQYMESIGIDQPSLPMQAMVFRSSDSLDTPENRFVKHALNDFLRVLLDIEDRLVDGGAGADLRLLREVIPLRAVIAGYLEAKLFKEVETATSLQLGSAVLQRRGGYREILESWLKFSLAARLSWSGGDEVFGAGKKDVALLYEYWLFFVLLDLVSEELNLDFPANSALIELTNDGFDMKLKAGSCFSVLGTYTNGEHPMRVRYSYNRTFSGVRMQRVSTYPRAGSWTRSMRPDFSLSFWPADFEEDEAERQELIVHIHFDAKYRVESIAGLFGSDKESEMDEEGNDFSTNGRPKRADLLKMHAYRDAIRRTEGAYVLYPGPLWGDQSWIEFHEILPGLGAFAIRPGNEQQSKQSLMRFLRDVLKHLTDSSTRREQQSYHVFRIQEHTEEFRSMNWMPSHDPVGRRLRSAPLIEKPEA